MLIMLLKQYINSDANSDKINTKIVYTNLNSDANITNSDLDIANNTF